MKTRKRNYLTIALFCFILAMIILAFSAAANAEKAPTDIQHWQMLNDGDRAYLLTQPDCYLTMQELGQDSRVFTLECDPVKDGQ